MVYMRWEQDLDLEELGSLGLFGEYLEMGIKLCVYIYLGTVSYQLLF